MQRQNVKWDKVGVKWDQISKVQRVWMWMNEIKLLGEVARDDIDANVEATKIVFIFISVGSPSQ